MPYITIPQSPKTRQITFEDIYFGTGEAPKSIPFDATGTITKYVKKIPDYLVYRYPIASMIRRLREFNEKYRHLIETEDKSTLYRSFKIPKRSGGLRQIDTPNSELMSALRELKDILEDHCGGLYHTTAYAYIHNRCTIDALKKHQRNNSKWFGKFDFHNFFGSTTKEFVVKMFSTIYPFSEILRRQDGYNAFISAIDLAFLNGGLPQGTPISPFITNVMMIPIDHSLNKWFNEHHLIYTRYADDILISSKYDFDINQMQETILSVLRAFTAPFELSTHKTRYGSSAGRNWNLGLMLNKDNKITVGYQRKKEFKAMLHNFIMDMKNNHPWDLNDVYHMLGLYSYYIVVEKNYFEELVGRMSERYGINPIDKAKMLIKGQ